MKTYSVKIDDIDIGPMAPLVVISGPCVIEDTRTTLEIATYLRDLTEELGLPFIFKASYDKANRTSIGSYRGPGITEGLRILADIRDKLGVRILSDVHEVAEVEIASRVLDVLQIPALLCRQTDLVVAAAETGIHR